MKAAMRAWVTAGIGGLAIFGLIGCSPTQEEIGPPDRLGPPGGCPEEHVVSLQEAIAGADFALALPQHPLASPQNVQAVCLDPNGQSISFSFPSPRPTEEPLRTDGLLITESPWEGGEPLDFYQEVLAEYPEQIGKKIHKIKGVPSQSDPAHTDQTGTDPAYLTLVLGRGEGVNLASSNGIEIQLIGGESVDDLIAIAETMEIITH